MIRKTLVALALFAVATVAAADTSQRIQQGVSLHDARKYDEAIAIFKAVLAEEPENDVAAYELALTYFAKGDFAQCETVLQPRVAREGKFRAAMYASLGNCLDQAGRAEDAIAMYRNGLRINPNETQLLYNLAVTLAQRGNLDEARELLKKELILRPDHASARFTLANIFATQNFRGPAVLESLRFLSLEPSGARARQVAASVLSLLSLGVETKGKKTNVTIDLKPRTEEGDYSQWQFMMAIAAAGQKLPEKKKLGEFERTREQIASSLEMLLEAHEGGTDYTARYNIPFFVELHQKGHIDVFAAVPLLSLHLPGQSEWLQTNAAAFRAYQTFMEERK